MEHINSTSIATEILVVKNSPPKAVIHSPSTDMNYDSSHLFEFNASGSGDYDSACDTFPGGVDWHCSDFEPAPGSEYLIYKWESNLDGILQEDGSDWLIFESHLSSGLHTITLTLNDGINPPVITSTSIEVTPSAPVLEIASPDLSKGYYSSEVIEFDIRDSIDYDGDSFVFTLTSDISGELLNLTDPLEIYGLQLEAGEHELTFTLIDENGLQRNEVVTLQVIESDPKVIIYEPMNNQFYQPGELIIFDSNGTSDADNDITRREWRLYNPSELYPEVLSNSAFFTTNLQPGVHHVSLYVEDRRGGSDEVHLNITVASSNPDLSNLSVSPRYIPVGDLTKVTVRITLDDPDGTTGLVNATITKNTQIWELNLTDENNDGIWIGDIEIIANEGGKAQLKVTAFDGEVIDYMSVDVDFVEQEVDNSSLFIIAGGVTSFLLIASLLVWLIIRRRKRLADIDLIESWGVFGGEQKEYLEEELED
jgi:hypothetical protein